MLNGILEMSLTLFKRVKSWTSDSGGTKEFPSRPWNNAQFLYFCTALWGGHENVLPTLPYPDSFLFTFFIHWPSLSSCFHIWKSSCCTTVSFATQQSERIKNQLRESGQYYLDDCFSYCSFCQSSLLIWPLLRHPYTRIAGSKCIWSTQSPLHIFFSLSNTPCPSSPSSLSSLWHWNSTGFPVHPGISVLESVAQHGKWFASNLDISGDIKGLRICSMQIGVPQGSVLGHFMFSLFPHSQLGHIISGVFIPLRCCWHSTDPLLSFIRHSCFCTELTSGQGWQHIS